jgi:hypothetical protein
VTSTGATLPHLWRHYIGGHMGRLGTRDDVAVHQRYFADMAENVRRALSTGEDVVLPGDLALRRAVEAAYRLDHHPTEDAVAASPRSDGPTAAWPPATSSPLRSSRPSNPNTAPTPVHEVKRSSATPDR